MKISVVAGRELSPDLCADWQRLLDASPELASPFLRPEYLTAVANARDDVFVGVLDDGSEIVGFFPFQRGKLRTGGPVGAPLCEYQAYIGDLSRLSPRELVAGCGLVAWEFDHLLGTQAPFAPFHLEVDESPVIDLTGGWKAYCDEITARGSDLFKQGLRKTRKLEREVGPVRFEACVTDPEVLRQLFAWKSEQCRRTGIFDVFRFDWPNDLVAQLHATSEPGFCGLVSAVYAGDALVAAHFGLRSRGVWHWWFPTYDVHFGRYSPGLILLLQMVMAADDLGVVRIDFGRGSEAYKLRARTGGVPVTRGRVECPSLVTSLRKMRRGTMSAVRNSPLARPAEAMSRLLRRGEKWLGSR